MTKPIRPSWTHPGISFGRRRCLKGTHRRAYGKIAFSSPQYFTASPVAADGKIYVCSQPGMVIVIEAGDEFKVLARNKIGERINATPALIGGRVYVRTEDHMFAFGNK